MDLCILLLKTAANRPTFTLLYPLVYNKQYQTRRPLHTIQVVPFCFSICCTGMIPILWRSNDSFSHSEFKSLVRYIPEF